MTVRAMIVSMLVGLVIGACDRGPEPLASVLIPKVTGTVTNVATGHPVAGAEVRIGDVATKTDAEGRFELTNLPLGPALLRCTAPGFVDFQANVTVPPAGAQRQIALTRVEVIEFGDVALYVPANVDVPRGVLLALGGPDTRGFATGRGFGAPPAVEPSLRALGQSFRELAASHRLMILGIAPRTLTDSASTLDQLLLNRLDTAAQMSGRPEVASTPILLYGMAAGASSASGFTARNPERVAGLFLKVPLKGIAWEWEPALVPTYMVLAELDAFANNDSLTATFEEKRLGGGLWALAQEPGAVHHSLSPYQRVVTVAWMRTILDLRLPATPAQPLREILATSGWLGDRATGVAWPWADYPGNRALASWLPSAATAAQWEVFVDTGSVAPSDVSRIRVVHGTPDALPLDVFVDSAKVLSSLAYLSRSPYLHVVPGQRLIRFVNELGTLSEVRMDFPGGADFTVMTCGATGYPCAFVFGDDNRAPLPGRARVRLIHDAGAGAADIYITAPGADLNTASPAIFALVWGNASDYVELPEGDYQVRVTTAGTKAVIIDGGTTTLAAGSVRSFLLADAPGGGQPWGLVVLADAH